MYNYTNKTCMCKYTYASIFITINEKKGADKLIYVEGIEQ